MYLHPIQKEIHRVNIGVDVLLCHDILRLEVAKLTASIRCGNLSTFIIHVRKFLLLLWQGFKQQINNIAQQQLVPANSDEKNQFPYYCSPYLKQKYNNYNKQLHFYVIINASNLIKIRWQQSNFIIYLNMAPIIVCYIIFRTGFLHSLVYICR